MGALAFMTVLSCLVGKIFHTVQSVKILLEDNELIERKSVIDEELKDAEETVECKEECQDGRQEEYLQEHNDDHQEEC